MCAYSQYLTYSDPLPETHLAQAICKILIPDKQKYRRKEKITLPDSREAWITFIFSINHYLLDVLQKTMDNGYTGLDKHNFSA